MQNCTCHKGYYNEHLINQGKSLIERTGLTEFLQHIVEIDISIGKGHRLLDRIGRARNLNLETGNNDQLKAEREFALAKRHISQSRKLLGDLANTQNWQDIVRATEEIKTTPAYTDSINEFEARWKDILLESNLRPTDTSEIMEILQNIKTTVDNSGFDVVVRNLDSWLGELDGVLNEGQNWGRNPHSPLEWWQWVIIAAILVISIAALIVCLVWFGCSWIAAIFVGLCAGASAATGAWWIGICFTVLF